MLFRSWDVTCTFARVKIINLTQHAPTPEQLGVFDFPENERKQLIGLLTFNHAPNAEQIWTRARGITKLVCRWAYENCKIPHNVHKTHEDYRAYYKTHYKALIGGAPYLMGPLEFCLNRANIQPLYSFSERKSVENIGPNGEVEKKSVFRHTAWIEACGFEEVKEVDREEGGYRTWYQPE